MRPSPPATQRNTNGCEYHAERAVVVHQIMIVVACTYGHAGKVLSLLHFPLQHSHIHLPLKQLILRQSRQSLIIRLRSMWQQSGYSEKIRCYKHKSLFMAATVGRHVCGDTAILSDEHLQQPQSIVQLQALTLQLVLPKFHLQQIVTEDETSLHSKAHIPMDGVQHLARCCQRLLLFLQRHHLPVVMLHLLLHLAFGKSQLQPTDVLPKACQPIAIHNLSTYKNWLYGRHTDNRPILHHGHPQWTSQCSDSFRRQNLLQDWL